MLYFNNLEGHPEGSRLALYLGISPCPARWGDIIPGALDDLSSTDCGVPPAGNSARDHRQNESS